MAKKQAQPTGWHEFGQLIAGVILVGGIVFFLYLLFVIPYERQKDTMYKLDRIDQTAIGHYEQYRSNRYTSEERRKG